MSPFFLRPFFFFFVSSSSPPVFLAFFSPPLFVSLIIFWQFWRGALHPYRHNTSFSLDLLSFSFLFSPLFSFFSFLFLSSLLFLFSLSLPADFWCGDRRHAAPLPTGLPKIDKKVVSSSTKCLISVKIAILTFPSHIHHHHRWWMFGWYRFSETWNWNCLHV